MEDKTNKQQYFLQENRNTKYSPYFNYNMTTKIKKIRLVNFKSFRDYTIEPNEHTNILVGDNEVGKSSILEAIDLVASGSTFRVEAIGLDRLLNIEAVNEFIQGERTFDNLPQLIVELYLCGHFDHTMNGKNNTDHVTYDGIRLVCSPNPDYRTEITETLSSNDGFFPYDYYSVRFSTFADEGYTRYKKKLRSVLIDSSNMNTGYATNDFVRRMYRQYTESEIKERAKHKGDYRKLRTVFQSVSLKSLNNRIPANKNYSFGLKDGWAMDFENELMIFENDISINNKGAGKQVFIKTDFALEKAGESVDVILFEEPENHLSPVNLRKLVHSIARRQTGQLFITTHNSLISTRLELRNLLIIHNKGEDRPIMLKDLCEETEKYFLKTPPAGIIEYALTGKALLVEGPSEYMLLDRFYKSITRSTPEDDDVHIIDIRGLSFMRYLELARLIGIKVAVITDNDGDYQKNCVERYSCFNDSNIKVFFDRDNTQQTFEIVLYNMNTDLCKKLFGTDAQYYMLSNKTEAAYKLMDQDQNINVPEYIARAISWIRG